MSWFPRLVFGNVVNDAIEEHYQNASRGRSGRSERRHHVSTRAPFGYGTASPLSLAYGHGPTNGQYGMAQGEICYCQVGHEPGYGHAHGQVQSQGHARGSRHRHHRSAQGRSGFYGPGPIHHSPVNGHNQVHHHSQGNGHFHTANLHGQVNCHSRHAHHQAAGQQAPIVPFRPGGLRAGIYAEGFMEGMRAAQTGGFGPNRHGHGSYSQPRNPRADPHNNVGGSGIDGSRIEELEDSEDENVPVCDGRADRRAGGSHGPAPGVPNGYPADHPPGYPAGPLDILWRLDLLDIRSRSLSMESTWNAEQSKTFSPRLQPSAAMEMAMERVGAGVDRAKDQRSRRLKVGRC